MIMPLRRAHFVREGHGGSRSRGDAASRISTLGRGERDARRAGVDATELPVARALARLPGSAVTWSVRHATHQMALICTWTSNHRRAAATALHGRCGDWGGGR